MNILQTLARLIIRKSFHLAVCCIESFHDTTIYEEKARQLTLLPKGTLGKDIAACLEKNKLRLVPGYESHDLKHVLLGFKMTPVDEIRIQAFMLGNGNYSPASFAIFIFGAVFLPDIWKTFYSDFSRGRKAMPVKSWTIAAYAHCNTDTLRDLVFNYKTDRQAIPLITRLVKTAAFTAIVAGVSGMCYCLPFLFSNSLADLIGAGLPFIGGALIAGSGLIALSNLAGRKTLAVKELV